MMVKIDGSIGEGGGQVLRVCIALSALTGESVAIKNVRVNRANPGLRPQHLTAMRALAEVANAKVDGLDLGSSEVTFVPGRRRGGIYSFDAKTAGEDLHSCCKHFCPCSHSPINPLLLPSSVAQTIL